MTIRTMTVEDWPQVWPFFDEILAADPYYSAVGVTITSVQEWNPVTRHHALDGL